MKITEILLTKDVTKANADMLGGEMLGTSIDEHSEYDLAFKYAGNAVYLFEDPEHSQYLIVDSEGTVTAVAMSVPFIGHEQFVSIQSAPGNKLKLADFYHLLILKGHSLVTDIMQSPGGRKVWERLAGMPHVNIQAYNTKSKKYTYLDSIDDAYVDPMDAQDMKTNKHRQHIVLVATQE